MDIKNFIDDARFKDDEREMMVIASIVYFILCFIIIPFTARWSWLEIAREHPWKVSLFMYLMFSVACSFLLWTEYWDDKNKYKGKRFRAAFEESIGLSLYYGFSWPIIGLKVIRVLIQKLLRKFFNLLKEIPYIYSVFKKNCSFICLKMVEMAVKKIVKIVLEIWCILKKLCLCRFYKLWRENPILNNNNNS